MIIAKQKSIYEIASVEEKDEFYIQSPVKTAKAMFGFEDFASSVNERLDSSRNISLVKRMTSGLPKIEENSFTVLEQSMAAHGFVITGHINPFEEEVKLAFRSRKDFWIGVFYLVIMIVCWSLIGPLTLSLEAGHTLVKATWRMQGSTIIIWMCSAYLYNYGGDKTMSFSRDFSLPILLNSMWGSFFGFVWGATLIVGCSLTLTSHAEVMYTCTGVYILAYSLVTCMKVHKYEIYGYIIFFVGAFLMFTDKHAAKASGEEASLIGALISFLGAGFGAVLGYLNSKSKTLHPIVTMTQFLSFTVVYQLIFFPLFIQDSRYYSFDSDFGAFGWLTKSRNTLMVLFLVSPITGVIGNIGYFTAYKYWPMQIIAAVILLEPFAGQTAGVLLGIDAIPGFKTCFGLCIITLGFWLATYGVSLKQEEELQKILEDSNLIEQELKDEC